MSEEKEKMSKKKEQMSEKKESDSSDQTDYVCTQEILTGFLDILFKKEDCKTSDNDLIRDFVHKYHLEEDVNESLQGVLRLYKAFAGIENIRKKASSSASSDPKTDLEASKKDTVSFLQSIKTISIQDMSEEFIHEQLTTYYNVLKELDNIGWYLRKHTWMCENKHRRTKKKEIETEEPKEEDCSKDGPSSKDTQTKALSDSESDLEVFKKDEQTHPDVFSTLKTILLEDIDKLLKELRKKRKQDIERQKLKKKE